MSVYLFFGTETFEIEKEIKKIITENEIDEMSKSMYDMHEVSISEALSDASTISFLGGKKCVIIRNPFFLSGTNVKTSVEHNLEAIEKYIETPNEDTILIFYAPYEKLDSRKKIVKTLTNKVEVKEFAIKDMSEKVVGMINDKLNLNEAQKSLLVTKMIGFSLEQVSREIEKVETYQLSNGMITDDVLEDLISQSLEQNVYSLADAVAISDYKKAFKIYNDLIKQKESPVGLLMLIASKFRSLIQIKTYEYIGNNFEIAKKIGMNPYAVKFGLRITQKVKMKELKDMLVKIAELDYMIKSGNIDQNRVLEFLVC